MKINFSKYNGAGNDFIVIDDRENNLHLTKSEINNLCNRNIGIGGDGLIIIKKSKYLIPEKKMMTSFMNVLLKIYQVLKLN